MDLHVNFKLFGTALLALALAACSTQPSRPAADAPAAPPAAVAPPAASAATAVPVARTTDSQTPAISRALLAAGYKATTIKDEVYYCRHEDVIGTGFKRKVCLNKEQLRDEERRIKEMQAKMLSTQASPGCLGPTCKDP